MRWILASAGMLLASSAVPAAAATPIEQCLSSSEEGQVSRDHGRLLEARDRFLTCGDDACPSIVQLRCVQWLEEVDALIPTVVFAARDEGDVDLRDVEVSAQGRVLSSRLDGAPIALDPGELDLVFTAGGRRVEQHVVLRAGEKSRIVAVRFAPTLPDGARRAAPTPRSSRFTVPTLLVGAGVLGLAGFSYFGFTAKSDLSNLESAPCAASRMCSPSDVDSVRTRFLVADVSLVVGLVSLAAATVVWLGHARPAR